MNRTCPVCGREVTDTAEKCECGANLRALRAEAEVAMLRCAVEGWRKTTDKLQADLLHQVDSRLAAAKRIDDLTLAMRNVESQMRTVYQWAFDIDTKACAEIIRLSDILRSALE